MKVKHIIDVLKQQQIVVLINDYSTWTSEEIDEATAQTNEVEKGLTDLGLKVSVEKINTDIEEPMKKYDPNKTVIFNWCEEFDGDGYDYYTVPKVLDKLGFAYTGNGPAALRLAADKYVAKEIMMAMDVTTPLSKLYLGGEVNGWHTFPALLKPAREHCSYGITRESVVDDLDRLHARVDELMKEFGRGVLVEDFIDGTEYNVAMWGNTDKPEVLPIGAIDYKMFDDYHDRICGFNSKWKEGSEEWNKTPVVCPAPMSDELKEKVCSLAIKTYQTFLCRGYTRVDIRVRKDEPYVLDVNPNPDITSAGGFARSADRAGYPYPEAITKLLGFAYDWKHKTNISDE